MFNKRASVGQGRHPVRFAVMFVLVVLVAASFQPLQAQQAFSLGLYGARHGVGGEAAFMLNRSAGGFLRAEGPLAVERAAWLGARLNVYEEAGSSLYVAPMAGAHYCYSNNLSGTNSGCEYNAEWKPAAALMAGADLALGPGPVSVGIESGYRFVDAGPRRRWTFAAFVRYRLFKQ